jgi:hypothetical protein
MVYWCSTLYTSTLTLCVSPALCCCRCVLELHAIASKKEEGSGVFEVAMTAKENRRFLKSIGVDPNECMPTLRSQIENV